MNKSSINLLQAELIPEKPLWTLQRVVSIWVVVLMLLLVWLGVTSWQLTGLETRFSQLKQQQQKLQQQKNKFEQQVINNKPQPASVEKLETLKLLLVNKTTLYKRLTQENSVYTSGFSSAMTELSKYHHRAISLHTIQMDANRVLFSGVARDPEAVPIWLTSFEQSTFLSGYLFTQFSMSENDHKQTTFVVSTDMGAE